MIVLPKLKLVFMAIAAFPFARALPEVVGTGSASESVGLQRDLKMMMMMSVKPSPAVKPVMPPTVKPTRSPTRSPTSSPITMSPTKSPTRSPTNSPTIQRICGTVPCTCTTSATCQSFVRCNTSPFCVCILDTEGRRICVNTAACNAMVDCNTSADCPSGLYCVPGTCCNGKKCNCPCGICGTGVPAPLIAGFNEVAGDGQCNTGPCGEAQGP
jgi:hypothetical protein